MNDKERRLAAAKRKLEEYKAQHRFEQEKISIVRDEFSMTNSNHNHQHPLSISNEEPIQNSGTFTVVIDDEDMWKNSSGMEQTELTPLQSETAFIYEAQMEYLGKAALQEANQNPHPSIPLELETPDSRHSPNLLFAKDQFQFPSILETNQKLFTKSDEGEEINAEFDTSLSNSNISPVVTPEIQSERATDTLHWVERDNLTKTFYSNGERSLPPITSILAGNNEACVNQKDQQHHILTNSIDRREAFELELSQLRQDNSYFRRRERELLAQLQEVEKIVQVHNQERETLKQEILLDHAPLKEKWAKLCDENMELKVIISDLRRQLNASLEENEGKLKKYEDMESAFIKVSNLKRELESNFDIENERSRSLDAKLKEQILRIEDLVQENERLVRNANTVESVVESRGREIKMQQIRINKLAKQVEDFTHNQPHPHSQVIPHYECSDNQSHFNEQDIEIAQEPTPILVTPTSQHYAQSILQQAQVRRKMDSIEETEEENQHEHDASHCVHAEEHEHTAHNKSYNGHNQTMPSLITQSSENGPTPMEKKLARLEWENLTYREELDKLAAILKTKTVDSNMLENLREESERLRIELGRLEHLVIQLQGENDTIGDYISLYQTQKLVLKEKVRANDREMETLSREREELRLKMEELNRLLTNYNETAEKPVEKIHQLVASINNTSANLASFHPCSVCSGNLMNV